jgi:hypothetical protein
MPHSQDRGDEEGLIANLGRYDHSERPGEGLLMVQVYGMEAVVQMYGMEAVE